MNPQWIAWGALLIASLPLVVGQTAEASVIHVDATPSGSGNDGSSWPDAYSDLQTALAAATSGDQIWVAEGSYRPTSGADRTVSFQLKTGVEVYGGFAGNELALGDRNPSNHTTTLTGDIGAPINPFDNTHHVIVASGVDDSAILDGFTITQGNANGVAPNDQGGGLLCSFGGSPTVRQCSISGNGATFGGGVYCGVDSSPKLVNCTLAANFSSGEGGGMLNKDASPVLINCLLSGNQAGTDGGGMFNEFFTSGVPILINCTLTGNRAVTAGGGIYNSFTSPTLTNTLIWNNQEGSVVTSPGASIVNFGLEGFGQSLPVFSHCLVANFSKATLDETGTSPDTNLNPEDPLFEEPIFSPGLTFLGDFRLKRGSPGINAGVNSANAEALDRAGNPRIANGTINLGAYEEAQVVYVDAAAAGANDGSSWAHAYLDLQDALSSVPRFTEIWVAEGTYKPTSGTDRSAAFRLKNEVGLYGGFVGGAVDFADRDPSTHATILSGDIGVPMDDSDNVYNVVLAINVSASTTLDGFTITGGNANGTIDECGGGIRISAASPVIQYCTIANNSAEREGGGLYLSSSSPTISHCSITDNSSEREGGGLFLIVSSPVFTDCTITSNAADLFGGGGYFSASAPAFHQCIISGNDASSGGGIYNFGASSTFTNCVFSGNSASSFGGGFHAIFEIAQAPSLINCTLSGNSAGTAGGAFACEASRLDLASCLMWNNRANGSSNTEGASLIVGSLEPDQVPTYTHCLIANVSKTTLDSTGTSPDTNFDPVDPLFVSALDPATAPSVSGDFRLVRNSPALNLGSNSDNLSLTDLDGNPRKVGVIDLGAYELGADSDGDGLPDAFESANTNPSSTTSLSLTADQDNDGLTVLHEFAYGLSDLTPDETGAPDRETVSLDGMDYQCLGYRRNRDALPFLTFTVQRSPDLSGQDPWNSGQTVVVSTSGTGDVVNVLERSQTSIEAQSREFMQLTIGQR